MATLEQMLLSSENFPKVISDCKTLIDKQVAQRKGLSGMAIKGGYKAVKRFRPDVIETSLESLLPEFVQKLEPFWQEYEEKGGSLTMRQFLQGNSSRVASALLSITDERARKTDLKVLKSAYSKLRPFAQENVEQALPDVGDLVQRYA